MAHNFAPPAARFDVTDVDGKGNLMANLDAPPEPSRKELLLQVAELEGCLQYMGAGHPQREATRARLAALQTELANIEKLSSKAR